MAENHQKGLYGKKNNLNNDFCDQRTSTTNSDSMVLKIQLQYLKMRASVPIYEAQCVVFTAAIRTNNDKLRVAGQGLGNTRAVRTNNAYEYSHPWLVQERVWSKFERLLSCGIANRNLF